jgi:hypothetical protein
MLAAFPAFLEMGWFGCLVRLINADECSTQGPYDEGTIWSRGLPCSSSILYRQNKWLTLGQWCLVLSGVADFARPAEKLSLTQNGALMATGAIWTRWCMIIKPRNVMCVFPVLFCPFLRLPNICWPVRLAAVNFFLGCVGVVQCSRIFLYQRSLQGSSVEAAKELEHEVADSAKSVAEKTENTVERSWVVCRSGNVVV